MMKICMQVSAFLRISVFAVQLTGTLIRCEEGAATDFRLLLVACCLLLVACCLLLVACCLLLVACCLLLLSISLSLSLVARS